MGRKESNQTNTIRENKTLAKISEFTVSRCRSLVDFAARLCETPLDPERNPESLVRVG